MFFRALCLKLYSTISLHISPYDLLSTPSNLYSSMQEFYCWAQNAALSVTEKIVGGSATVSEDKVCSAALRLMFQILNWNFKHTTSNHSGDKTCLSTSGIRHEPSLLKKFERFLVQVRIPNLLILAFAMYCI